jgi:uncharacterized membrane protein (DUF485 family)
MYERADAVFESFSERGGFLRRAFALMIDIIMVGAVVHLIGFAAYPLTNGYVQSAGVIRYSQCKFDTIAPPGIIVRLDFDPNHFAECRHGLFGFESARTLTVGRVDRVGELWGGTLRREQKFTVMLDRDGRVIRGVPLDLLLLPLLVLYRIAFERRFGAALGKWMLQQRVTEQANLVLASFDSIVRRNLFFALPFLPGFLLFTWLAIGTIPASLYWTALGFSIGCILIAGALASIQIIRRRETFYDRRAGTTVIQKPFYPDAVIAEQQQK